MSMLQFVALLCALPIMLRCLYVSKHAKYEHFGNKKLRWLLIAVGYAMKGSSALFIALGVPLSVMGLLVGAAMVAMADRRSGAKRMYFPPSA